MKNFNGKVLFLDRSDINTDEIIPAKYLTEIDRKKLGPRCLEDLILDGFDAKRDVLGKTAVLTRNNFGCGSSREHAPWALEANGIHVVFAEGFARIFRQNMFNCGMIAAEFNPADIDDLFSKFAKLETTVSVDIDKKEATFSAGSLSKKVPFHLGPFDETLVRAGGWVEYADKNY